MEIAIGMLVGLVLLMVVLFNMGQDATYHERRLREVDAFRVINRYNRKKTADMFVVQRRRINVYDEEIWVDMCEFYTEDEARECIAKLERDKTNGYI